MDAQHGPSRQGVGGRRSRAGGPPPGPGGGGPVGFIGVGSMGGPMVERLLAAGHTVHLFARRPGRAAQFARLGAVVEPSVAAVAASCSVLVLCPFAETQLGEITGGPDGALAHLAAGSVLVQHATVSRDAIVRLAAAGHQRGIEVLDAPVSGTSEAIGAGRLTVLLGGDAAAVARVEPVLRSYAATIVPTGAAGTASTTKLVNNLLFAAHAQTAAAAVDLGRALGIDAAALLRALTVCSGNSYAVGTLAAFDDPGEFAERAVPFLRKDVALVTGAAARLGLDTGLLGEIVRGGSLALADLPAAGGTPTGNDPTVGGATGRAAALPGEREP